MADITMCSGLKCPLKSNCYRALAIPNEFRQSYFLALPFDGEGCKYQWDLN